MKKSKNKYFTAKEYIEYIELKTKVETLKRVFAEERALGYSCFNTIMGYSEQLSENNEN